MNPLNLKPLTSSPLLPERVTLPGVDEAAVDALQEGFDRFARDRTGFLRAMLALGKPIARRPVPARKRSRATAHVRRMRDVRSRVAYLKA